MPAADVALRPATIDDADTLLAWANDPAVREGSFSSRPIERPEHLAWLTTRLADPACAMWMGLARSDATPIGVVRFERDAAGVAVVSIIVAAEARGHGFGAVLLDDGLAAARTALRPSAFRAWSRIIWTVAWQSPSALTQTTWWSGARRLSLPPQAIGTRW